MKAKAKQYAQALFWEIKDKKNEDLKVILSNFLDILKKDNCVSQIEKIIAHFNNLWKKEHSLVEAEITTAGLLEGDLKMLMTSYLMERSKAEKIKIQEKENKKIIGGFVIKYDDRIIDASIKNKINLFKNNLTK